jgi:hypothetical protein
VRLLSGRRHRDGAMSDFRDGPDRERSRFERSGICVVRKPPVAWISNHGRPSGTCAVRYPRMARVSNHGRPARALRCSRSVVWADKEHGRFLTVQEPAPLATATACPARGERGGSPTRGDSLRCSGPSGRQLAGNRPFRATSCGAPSLPVPMIRRGRAARRCPGCSLWRWGVHNEQLGEGVSGRGGVGGRRGGCPTPRRRW